MPKRLISDTFLNNNAISKEYVSPLILIQINRIKTTPGAPLETNIRNKTNTNTEKINPNKLELV